MSDGTPFLRVAADRIGAPGSAPDRRQKMPFRATNAANWSSIIRIGAKMAVIRRRIARRAVSSHTIAGWEGSIWGIPDQAAFLAGDGDDFGGLLGRDRLRLAASAIRVVAPGNAH